MADDINITQQEQRQQTAKESLLAKWKDYANSKDISAYSNKGMVLRGIVKEAQAGDLTSMIELYGGEFIEDASKTWGNENTVRYDTASNYLTNESQKVLEEKTALNQETESLLQAQANAYNQGQYDLADNYNSKITANSEKLAELDAQGTNLNDSSVLLEASKNISDAYVNLANSVDTDGYNDAAAKVIEAEVRYEQLKMDRPESSGYDQLSEEEMAAKQEELSSMQADLYAFYGDDVEKYQSEDMYNVCKASYDAANGDKDYAEDDFTNPDTEEEEVNDETGEDVTDGAGTGNADEEETADEASGDNVVYNAEETAAEDTGVDEGEAENPADNGESAETTAEGQYDGAAAEQAALAQQNAGQTTQDVLDELGYGNTDTPTEDTSASAESDEKPNPYAYADFVAPERNDDMTDEQYASAVSDAQAAYDTAKAAYIDSVNQSVADDIWINGSWGNGEERVDNLEAAGYDVDAVQEAINKTYCSEPAVSTPVVQTTQAAVSESVASDSVTPRELEVTSTIASEISRAVAETQPLSAEDAAFYERRDGRDHSEEVVTKTVGDDGNITYGYYNNMTAYEEAVASGKTIGEAYVVDSKIGDAVMAQMQGNNEAFSAADYFKQTAGTATSVDDYKQQQIDAQLNAKYNAYGTGAEVEAAIAAGEISADDVIVVDEEQIAALKAEAEANGEDFRAGDAVRAVMQGNDSSYSKFDEFLAAHPDELDKSEAEDGYTYFALR